MPSGVTEMTVLMASGEALNTPGPVLVMSPVTGLLVEPVLPPPPPPHEVSMASDRDKTRTERTMDIAASFHIESMMATIHLYSRNRAMVCNEEIGA